MSECKYPFWRSCLRAFVAAIIALAIPLPMFGMDGGATDGCMAREGTKSILNAADRSIYERKLFVTPDEVVRYMFLTNRYDDGDRSAGIYRAPSKKGGLPGDYWLTVTEAAGSLTAETRNVRVRRNDAPLPPSVAQALHRLWLAVLKQSRIKEHATPCAPTGVFSVTTTTGERISAVTVSLDQNSLCIALMNIGESLIGYAKLPASQRAEAARKIEMESQRLLARISQK